MRALPSNATFPDHASPDAPPPEESFLNDVLNGLSKTHKSLPCKYFYDQRGSQLFDRICQLDEYYLTRTELAIMQSHAAEMAGEIGPNSMLVEFGSGSSIKTRLLLDHLPTPAAYVPVDISRKHLHTSAEQLQRAYPEIDVHPVCADFTQSFELPRVDDRIQQRTVYFPGSTIGNFDPVAARRLIDGIAELCTTGGGLLIGIDLQKDAGTLKAAYDDAAGVTAQFNLNLLHRINSELGGDFDVDQFSHVADYNDVDGRMEIYLQSRVAQHVNVDESTFSFASGERIHTEYSHKYTIDGFSKFVQHSGFTLQHTWTDDDQMFAVLHFVC